MLLILITTYSNQEFEQHWCKYYTTHHINPSSRLRNLKRQKKNIKKKEDFLLMFLDHGKHIIKSQELLPVSYNHLCEK